ncbi:hypothetical protein [Gordonia humi]|uniref:Uncharacterized protein n=1 Tax=Gordonia humi TaxID=686429 RepID=A0A840F5S5_9ACTN|nr:hypothetical protein [Gordonia humi]MBB4134887.1 hypothetical protein [Gordonia humi]
MSYDQWLIPVRFADDPETASRHAVEQDESDAPAAPEAAALADAITRAHGPIEDASGFLSVFPLEATGDCVFVPSRFPAVELARATVIPLAFGAGFAVYDPQHGVLLDPRDAVAGTFVYSSDDPFPTITPSLIDLCVPAMRVEDFVIAETGENVYIQTKRVADDEYLLEYRDGSPDRHFGTTVSTAEQVAAAVRGWLTGDDSSYRGHHWERIEF